MSYFDLNDDVKSTFSKHFWSDYKISTLFTSKHQDLQKTLIGEIVFDNDFLKNKKRHDDVRDNDDLNNA